MFFSVLSFFSGIIIVQQLSVLPELFWVLVLFFLALALAFFRYFRLMFFIFGLLWTIVFANFRLADRLPESLQGQYIEIEGKITGLPLFDERRVRFDFVVSKPKDNFPEKIRLSWFFPKQKIKANQHWQFTVKLKKPHGRLNPGGFDYERWLFVQNIGATGYVRNKPKPRLVATNSIWQSVDDLRQKIADRLMKIEDTEYIGVIKALTIGKRDNISQQQWETFRKTGTIHLLAISGLHIGLVASLMYFLVLNIGIRFGLFSAQKMAAFFAISIAIFYSALAGFSIPTQRALLMLTIAMAAISWQRNITSINTLALALLAVLIVDPFAVLSAGFWLSFLAVALIIYSLASRLGKAGYWVGAIRIHWVTAIGLAPLLLLFFQQVSIIAPIANLLMVPVISLIVVPLCLIAVLLMVYSTGLAEQLLALVSQILHGVGFILSKLAALPYSTISTSSLPLYSIPLAVCGVVILLAPRGVPVRWLGIVMFLPLVFVEIEKPGLGEVKMTLLDVGQGLSAVIETSDHVLVFDSGAKYSEQYDMGNAVVIPFLQSKQINLVDTLIISHADNDHIGGAESIIEGSQVNKIFVSAVDMLEQYSPVQCQAGQSWVWDQVRFEILSPRENIFIGENDNSCVLKVSSDQGSILLTGDIEVLAENWLVNNAATQLASDILIAPHHGSKTSSSIRFLKQVAPSIILIPSGFKNRFGFPHQEVLKRYEAINAAVFNVADQGALIIKVKNDLFVVRSSRSEQSSYWNK